MAKSSESAESLLSKNSSATSFSSYNTSYTPSKSVPRIIRRNFSRVGENVSPLMNAIDCESHQSSSHPNVTYSSTGISEKSNSSESIREGSSNTPNATKSELLLLIEDAFNAPATSLMIKHKSELSRNNEYRIFYQAVRDFALDQNHNEELERGLIIAVQNIWAIKQIHLFEQHPLLEHLKREELDSSNGESSTGLGPRMDRFHVDAYQSSEISEMETTDNEATPHSRYAHLNIKSKRTLNRRIEEVVDDIFNLNSNHLFEGVCRDPVCKYCFERGGQLLKCSKGCPSWFHIDCLRKESFPAISKRGRRPAEHQRGIKDISANDSEGAITQSEFTATASLKIACAECAMDKPMVCSICNKPNGTGEELMVCKMKLCFKAFHQSCCQYWPQTKIIKAKTKSESFRCPSHICHTCVSDDPRGIFQQLSSTKLIKCLKCPATYHADSTCIPAGSQVVTADAIICPRHSICNKSDKQPNVNWCFICAEAGEVVFCKTCPLAVHAKCLKIPIDAKNGYICEECESGRLPLYAEIIWAKLTSFGWWPGIILPPTVVPNHVQEKPHNPGDFVVRFFGTHDHGWMNRRQVYLYSEDDNSDKIEAKSYLDLCYNRGVDEAKKIYDNIKLKREKLNISCEKKGKFCPQPYVQIKTNCAVPPVKLHVDKVKDQECGCNPDAIDPCGPQSYCLNRAIYQECNPTTCPAGMYCQNQMFKSRIYPRMDVVYTKERGFGLVSLQAIREGDFIIEYVGEVINNKEFQQRMAQKLQDRDENYYFLNVEKDFVIDSQYKGNMSRFMNHSCDPNCEAQKWIVGGLYRIGLFAIKNIPPHTELTFNYNSGSILRGEKRNCLCGTAKCVGYIGAKPETAKGTRGLADIYNIKHKLWPKLEKKQTSTNIKKSKKVSKPVGVSDPKKTKKN